MSRARRVPLRTCVGCGVAEPQSALVRFVRAGDAALRVDAQRRAGGRGAYLHPRPECWARFTRRKGSVRSLRVAVDRPARAALVAQLSGCAGE